MQARFITHGIIFFVILGGLVSLAGCGGGSSEPSERPQGSEQAAAPLSEELSTVQGTVAGIATRASMRSRDDNPSMFAQLKNFLAFLRTADAQSRGVEGIDVRAVRNDATLDSDSTDADGGFELTFPSGNISLVFSTDAFSVALEISTPSGGTLTLVVRLSPDRVDIDEVESINCTSANGMVDIKEPDSVLTIDGNGETCIIAADNCTVNLEAQSLTLLNCLSCIDASNNANVSLRTTETFQCTASEHGITTANNAQVNLNAGENIRIVADRETGAATMLNAADASNINLNASSGSMVIGAEDAVVAIGVRAVNTAQVNVNAN